MKKDTEGAKPVENAVEDDDDEELDEEEKLFYQMIWGKVWDEEYPPKKPTNKG